ncbi:MAG: sulfite exporter TauE/SafE family protein [Promethearchaeati archaeon]
MLESIFEPYLFILLMAFILGVLHTILPCEDKAIFLFWSLGISKTPKKSFIILALYGFGLISANLIIAGGLIFISVVPFFFGLPIPNSNTINFLGALSSIIAALVLLLVIIKGRYIPHNLSDNELPSQMNWEEPKTPYIFGILAGFAPCIFEFIIYTQCIQYTISEGFLLGLMIVFMFSSGTFIGLFPLALAKLGTSQIFKRRAKKKNRILYAMTIIIILFNVIVMILSVLEITIFPVTEISTP